MLPENRSGTASGAPSALTWGAAPLRRRPPGRFRPFEPTPNPQPHCRRKSKFLSVFETLLLLVTCVWIIRAAEDQRQRQLPLAEVGEDRLAQVPDPREYLLLPG